MFEGLLLLLIDNGANEDLQALERVLVQEDIPFHTRKSLNTSRFFQEMDPHITTSITHIISETTDFTDFDTALSSMIPVVKPQWVWDSLKLSRLLSTNPYSPLDTRFMKDIYLCVADSLETDKNFIYSAVRAFGGQYLDSLTRFTTHLVAEDMLNDKLLIAASAITDVTIVEPQWLWESLDEMTIASEKSHNLAFEKISSVQESEANEASKAVGAPLYNDESPPDSLTKLSSIFTGKSFYLSPDYQLANGSRNTIVRLIYRHGGVVTDTIDNVNVYIGQYREGELYQRALDHHNPPIILGTLPWLYYVLVSGKWVDPIHLNILHFPWPRQGIPEFSNLKISISNYSGDARFYLSQLITIMGGTFTRTLSKENDFLIASSPIGKKYDAVMHKWDSEVKIVNHLWLEDCFVNWEVTDWRDSRYGIGNQTQLLGICTLAGTIHSKTKDANDSPPRKKQKTQEERDKNVESERNQNVEKEGEENVRKKEVKKVLESPGITTKEPPVGSPKSSIESRHIQKQILEDSVDINGKSKRSAARLAAEKLHTNMTDLNDYQQMTKSVRKEKEFMENLEAITPSKKSIKENLVTPKTNSNESTLTTYAILTGCEPGLTLSRSDIEALKSYGISILLDYSEKHQAEVIVAPRILRTEKFLKCFGQAKYIVHPKYIEDILAVVNDKQPTKIKVEDYWLHKIMGAKLVSEALGLPKKQLPDILNQPDRGHVFAGLQINLSAKLDGSVEVISRILKAHQCVSTKETKTISNMLKSKNGKTILIAHATKDTKLVSSFKKQIPDGVVLKWEWCVKSIFSLTLQDFDQYCL